MADNLAVLALADGDLDLIRALRRQLGHAGENRVERFLRLVGTLQQLELRELRIVVL